MPDARNKVIVTAFLTFSMISNLSFAQGDDIASVSVVPKIASWPIAIDGSAIKDSVYFLGGTTKGMSPDPNPDAAITSVAEATRGVADVRLRNFSLPAGYVFVNRVMDRIRLGDAELTLKWMPQVWGVLNHQINEAGCGSIPVHVVYKLLIQFDIVATSADGNESFRLEVRNNEGVAVRKLCWTFGDKGQLIRNYEQIDAQKSFDDLQDQVQKQLGDWYRANDAFLEDDLASLALPSEHPEEDVFDGRSREATGAVSAATNLKWVIHLTKSMKKLLGR